MVIYTGRSGSNTTSEKFSNINGLRAIKNVVNVY